MNFRQEIINLLHQETKISTEELSSLVSIPPDPKLGDYAFPCFRLAGNPKEAAEKLKKKLKLPEFVEKAEVAGPYLNFFLNPVFLSQKTLTEIFNKKKDYGKQDYGNKKSIVFDFSSPNIAKPFGIGHLRSTVIGSCLYKVYSALGYKSIGVNHLGDWGTQFGKLIVAYKKWGDEKELEQNPIKYLLQLYVRFHEEAERDPKLDDQARAEFRKLEQGDKKSLALWECFKELSLKEFKDIYQLLSVEFDHYCGEAFYNGMIEATISQIKKKVRTEMSDGALIINLENEKLPALLLRKSDESSTYHTRDLAAALYRMKEYKAERLVYVVGSEQRMHFQQLFSVLQKLGFPKEKFVHVDFGLFRFPEGKMSTRKGKVIFLEEVLNKAMEMAEKIIEEKNPGLKNKKEVAKMVGIGAIIFGDLSNDRIKDVEFDWNRILSFEGETAPYLQYTHARACSILRKAKSEKQTGVSPKADFEVLSTPEELAVIKKLSEFPDILVKVAQTYKPHHLAGYLIVLGQQFNAFYHKHPVIAEHKELMKARLLLVDSVRQVLENGLKLMGIRAPDEM